MLEALVAGKPNDLENAARATFATLDDQPAPVRHDQGGTHEPADRYLRVLRASRIIAATDAYAQAVVALLAERGVEATAWQVRVDPALGADQVMALRTTVDGQDALVPLHPHATTLRAFPVDTPVDLTGVAPLAVIDLPTTAAWTDTATAATALAARTG
ncbi:hypothetical protein [Actinosynnema sp. NPDC020468]|uniref:hypothetical protein n=1 Tax=Actinosynnema sp. NPDC020468 TaxID=3154488 RepID=UPI0033C14955